MLLGVTFSCCVQKEGKSTSTDKEALPFAQLG
jgi:hypothetical protein